MAVNQEAMVRLCSQALLLSGLKNLDSDTPRLCIDKLEQREILCLHLLDSV